MDTCTECGEPIFDYDGLNLHVRTQTPECTEDIAPPELLVDLPPLPDI